MLPAGWWLGCPGTKFADAAPDKRMATRYDLHISHGALLLGLHRYQALIDHMPSARWRRQPSSPDGAELRPLSYFRLMLGWRFISGALRALLAGYDRAEDCFALRRNLEVSCYQFRGKTAVIVPGKDQLVSNSHPLIEVEAGELDEHLAQQAKARGVPKSTGWLRLVAGKRGSSRSGSNEASEPKQTKSR